MKYYIVFFTWTTRSWFFGIKIRHHGSIGVDSSDKTQWAFNSWAKSRIEYYYGTRNAEITGFNEVSKEQYENW